MWFDGRNCKEGGTPYEMTHSILFGVNMWDIPAEKLFPEKFMKSYKYPIDDDDKNCICEIVRDRINWLLSKRHSAKPKRKMIEDVQKKIFKIRM